MNEQDEGSYELRMTLTGPQVVSLIHGLVVALCVRSDDVNPKVLDLIYAVVKSVGKAD